MQIFNAKPVIDILSGIISNNELDIDKIDEAIDVLENIKTEINASDDEAIDKVDEIQDYLQYLLAVKEPVMEEIQEEVASMIGNLLEQ